MPLSENEVRNLKALALSQLSVPLTSSADRVDVAARAVRSTVDLLSQFISLDKPKPETKEPEPQPAPAPEKPKE